MRKKFLQNKIERIKNKIKDLKARALASQSADEVRSIQEQIEGYNADMADAQDEPRLFRRDHRPARPG